MNSFEVKIKYYYFYYASVKYVTFILNVFALRMMLIRVRGAGGRSNLIIMSISWKQKFLFDPRN